MHELRKTESRAYGAGACVTPPLSDAEARWLGDAMFADARLDCCAWIVHYGTANNPGRRPTELLIEAARAEWVVPEIALPAFAEQLQRFLAQWRPAASLTLTWALWPVGGARIHRPSSYRGGVARITATAVCWEPALPTEDGDDARPD